MKRCIASLFSLAALALAWPAAAQAPDAAKLYAEHCAACHGIDRLGGQGPALIPEGLARLRRDNAAAVIAKGRPATQMGSFEHVLSPAAVQAMVGYIYAPLPRPPVWGLSEISGSHEVAKPRKPVDRPVFTADPLNLFVVVETGDHHVTILDGDRLEPIHRFQSRFALHGGPKFTSDGRYVYFGSRDGWVTKYDIWSLSVVAEVRAGINTRNIAVSSDNKTVLVANYLPHTLVALDAADLKPLAIIPVADHTGKTSRVSAVYNAAPRKSFIAALKDIPEVWEIHYGDNPPFKGWVHDWRDDGPPKPAGKLPIRKIPLSDTLDDFFFDQGYEHLVGSGREGRGGQVIDLYIGKKVAEIALNGLPHLGSGITWKHGDTTVLATPNLKAGEITVIDMKDWSTLKRIATPGPGFFMRSHERSRYAFTDVMLGPAKDTIQIVDKQTLSIARELRPAPGKTAAHVEFDRYGRYALVSVWEQDGALVVYDAATLDEVKRLPMKRPSGKYNVYNKITFSEGTSH